MKNLELWVASLRPPKLPDTYFTDKATVDAGRLLYKQRCAACHAMMDRKDLTTPITAQMFWTGSAAEEQDASEKIIATEPLMAQEFLDRKNDLGTLRISPQLPIWSLPVRVVNTFLPSVLTQEELPLAGQMILGSAIVNAALGVMTEDDALEVLKHPVKNSNGVLQEITQTAPQYRAGPLNGVWATAPYLHNGSVASLDQLLTPSTQRSTGFCLSGREFDSVVVGFKNDPACSSTIDTTKEGNRNAGHDFGTGLQPSEKRALIEFLKSL